MNRLLAIIALCLWSLPASAEPGRHWQSFDPASAGWTATALQPLRDYAGLRKPTALMLVQNGAVLASFGDPGRKVGVASVRKSLLSALYGIAMASRSPTGGSGWTQGSASSGSTRSRQD